MTVKTIISKAPKASSHTQKNDASRTEKIVTQAELDPDQPTTDPKKSAWVEGSPSFLDAVLASLATLTEEEKDAIHLALHE